MCLPGSELQLLKGRPGFTLGLTWCPEPSTLYGRSMRCNDCCFISQFFTFEMFVENLCLCPGFLSPNLQIIWVVVGMCIRLVGHGFGVPCNLSPLFFCSLVLMSRVLYVASKQVRVTSSRLGMADVNLLQVGCIDRSGDRAACNGSDGG